MLSVTKVKAFFSRHIFRKEDTAVKENSSVSMQKSSSALLDFDSACLLYSPVASPIVVKTAFDETAKKSDSEEAIDDKQFYPQRPRISFDEYVKDLGVEFVYQN